eukprot:4255234-Pyramimonas_sp.AAC.1
MPKDSAIDLMKAMDADGFEFEQAAAAEREEGEQADPDAAGDGPEGDVGQEPPELELVNAPGEHEFELIDDANSDDDHHVEVYQVEDVEDLLVEAPPPPPVPPPPEPPQIGDDRVLADMSLPLFLDSLSLRVPGIRFPRAVQDLRSSDLCGGGGMMRMKEDLRTRRDDDDDAEEGGGMMMRRKKSRRREGVEEEEEGGGGGG